MILVSESPKAPWLLKAILCLKLAFEIDARDCSLLRFNSVNIIY